MLKGSSKKFKYIYVRVTAEEKHLMKKNAKKYAAGSMSRWARYAMINVKPKRKDLVRPRHS